MMRMQVPKHQKSYFFYLNWTLFWLIWMHQHKAGWALTQNIFDNWSEAQKIIQSYKKILASLPSLRDIAWWSTTHICAAPLTCKPAVGLAKKRISDRDSTRKICSIYKNVKFWLKLCLSLCHCNTGFRKQVMHL